MTAAFGLDKAHFCAVDVDVAGKCAYDAVRDGAAELAERVADRHDLIADLKLVAVADESARKTGRLNLDDRDIAVGIGADQFRVVLSAILERDLDGVRAADDVVVRDDQTVGADDDSAARAGSDVVAAPEGGRGRYRLGDDLNDGRRHGVGNLLVGARGLVRVVIGLENHGRAAGRGRTGARSCRAAGSTVRGREAVIWFAA